MSKKAALFCFCLLLFACRGGQVSAPNSALTTQTQTSKTEECASYPKDAEPNPETDVIRPIAKPVSVQTEAPSEKSARQAPSQNKTQEPDKNQTSNAQASPVTQPRKQEPVFTPAPDKTVFKDEKQIDLSGRVLHPYAALTPNENAEQTAPWAYEQLKYGVYYGFIKAGTAYIRNRGLVGVNGKEAYLLQTTAFSAPVIDAFFKVRDINHSWLDARDFYSLGYGQSVREGGYKRDEWVTFDYTNNRYGGIVQKKEAPRDIQGSLDIKVLDILTSLYYVRTQELTPGKDVVFDIVNREKQYPLIVKVLRKETVKTDAGTFACVLVEPQLRGEGIFISKGKSLKVWLTDDKYKMPVKMKVEVFIGSVSAQLLEYKRQEPVNIL